MDKVDLIYDIVVNIEKKMDNSINKLEEKVDNHIAQTHSVSLSAKQITALTGILAVITGAGISVLKIIIG